MELRERVIAVLRTTELWRDMDGIGTLDTYGPADSDYAKLANAAISAVLDALQEPSAEVVKAGEVAAWDSGNCMPVPSYTKAAWLGMLAAFRTEAVGEEGLRAALLKSAEREEAWAKKHPFNSAMNTYAASLLREHAALAAMPTPAGGDLEMRKP